MRNSSKRPNLWLVGLMLAAASAGCHHPRRSTEPFFLPSAGPDAEVLRAEIQGERLSAGVAVLSSAAVMLADRSAERSEATALSANEVLDVVSESFPLLTIVDQQRVIAQAKELEALGAFDLKAKAKAYYQPKGFFQNHGLEGGLEQATGLYGARLLGSYRLGVGDFDESFDGKRFTNHGGELGAGLSLPLLRNGATDEDRTKLYQAGLDRRQAEYEILAARLEFAIEALRAYWDWVEAGQSLGVKEELLTIAIERQRFVDRQVRAGALPEIESLDNARELADRRAEQLEARRKVDQKALKLGLFLRDLDGRPRPPSLERMPGALQEPAEPQVERLSEDLAQALELDPMIAMLAIDRERTEADISLYENQKLPEANLTSFVSQDRNDEPKKSKAGLEFKLGLEFSMPVQMRKARGRYQAAQAKKQQIEAKLGFARDKAEARVRQGLAALIAGYERAAQARVGVDLAERVTAAERLAFERGASDILKVNLREQKLAKARLLRIETLVEYWLAVAEYRASVAFRL